jgi:hypothetical protein
MKMLKYLLNAIDYMYFRIAKTYFKEDGKGASTALLGISLFLAALILAPILVIIGNLYGDFFILANKTVLSIVAISLQVVFLCISYFRYKKIGEILNSKWADEKEPDKTTHGVLVVIALLFPFILIVLDIII